MSIKPVTVYQTNDRKQHTTTEKAEKHVIDRIAQVLDSELKVFAEGGRFTANDIFTIIDHLTKDYTKISRIVSAMNYHLK